MKNITFYLILLLLTFFASCRKNSNDLIISKENILNDNAHIVDTAAIKSATLTSLTIIKSKLNFEPKIGDIILASPNNNNPKGVIAKVISIAINGDNINCTIKSSNLNEAFKQLYIDYKYVKDYSHYGQLKGSVLGIPFPKDYSIASGFTVNGILQLNIPDVEIKYSKPNGALMPDTVLILANVNADGSDIEMKATGALNIPEKTLYTYNNLPIIEVPVPVAGVPLIIPFWQYVELNSLPINIDGKLRLRVFPQFSASLGFSYVNGNWSNLSGYNLNASVTKPVQSDFETSMTGNITFFNPTYKIGPFWDPTLFAFFKIPNELEAKIQNATPDYSIKYKLGIEAGVHYDFFLGLSGTKSFSVPVYSKIIKEGNFGDNIYNIGDNAFGGIIFYLDSSKQHGLVYSQEELSNKTPWDLSICPTIYNPTNQPPPLGTSTSFDSGMSNTLIIINAVGSGNYAARVCRNYNGGGYNDWFLPSFEELKALYKSNLIPRITTLWENHHYLSSSEKVVSPNESYATGLVMKSNPVDPYLTPGDSLTIWKCSNNESTTFRAIRKF